MECAHSDWSTTPVMPVLSNMSVKGPFKFNYDGYR